LGDPTTNIVDMLMGSVNGQVHNFLNNSTNATIIYPNVRWRHGGAGTHTFVFDGLGNWNVTNYLITGNNSPTLIAKSGAGTMMWTGAKVPSSAGNSAIISPVVINGGTLILRSSDLLNNQDITNNGALLKYDAATGVANLSGGISGGGMLQVNAGVLMLSGQNIFTGTINLSGGMLVAAATETVGVGGPLGVAGVISFHGGMLGYSLTNTFDYSPRFDTSAGQVYNIVTAGQNVTFANGLGSSGGTLSKFGSGTLTLAGTSSYSGSTIISAGEVVFQGPKTGTGGITVSDGAGLGVFDKGTQTMPSGLALGTSAGCTLEFYNITNQATAPLAAGTLTSAGTVLININSGAFTTIGQAFPLLSWTSGSAPAASLGTLNGATGFLSTNGNTLELTITVVAYVWTGATNGNWDLTSSNWLEAGGPTTFSDGVPVRFDDTATGPTSVTNVGVEHPQSVMVANPTKAYTISSGGGGYIGGSGGLTKNGGGTLTLSGGANTYSGATVINGGTLSVGALANGGFASDIGAAGSSAANVVLDGGTLQYTGPGAGSDRLFTLGPASGTIDASGAGALTLTNPGSVALSGSSPRVLTLAGASTANNTFAPLLSDSSAGGVISLTKSGSGSWILSANNTYSGQTTIAGGLLQVGEGSSSGSLGTGNVLDNGGLVFDRAGNLTVGTITGTGSVAVNGSGTITLWGDNTYTGGTVINAGYLQIGNGGNGGKLDPAQPVVDNGTLIFNSASDFTYNGVISGTGSVTKYGTGTLTLTGTNTYSGITSVS
jgi:autotransporter-associated beta strand protein